MIDTLWITSLTIGLPELGDKTQIAALGITARFPAFPTMVFIGAFLGLTITTLLGVVLGRTVAQKIPRKAISIIAATIFIAFGVISFLTIE